MNSEERTVRSTSRSSAVTEDIILRETGTTRLVFRPMLVKNERDPKASVKGTFIFQRKGKSEKWEDEDFTPLSSLKKGQSVKLDLKSEELKKLHGEVSYLYELYESEGIPLGRTRFIKASETVQALAVMSDEELTSVIGGRRTIGAEALSRLIRWASHAENFSLLFERLKELGQKDLVHLNSALGVATLKRALKQWFNNRTNDNEEFWQQLLAKHAFVLEQIFQIPVLVIKSKAYVGGKSVLNIGGNIVDFLIKNKVTNTVALVEIKTPVTQLLGRQYREGVYNISQELSGAVMQVLTYRDTLSQDRSTLLYSKHLQVESFDPMCVVIIGNSKQLSDKEKLRSFELYRRQLSDVRIITYDEMYERTRRLVQVLSYGLSAG